MAYELHSQAPMPSGTEVIVPSEADRALPMIGTRGVVTWQFDPALPVPAGVGGLIDHVNGTVTLYERAGLIVHQAVQVETI